MDSGNADTFSRADVSASGNVDKVNLLRSLIDP